MEDRFLADLQSRVAGLSSDVLTLAYRAYDLDCLIALARAARDLGLVRPALTDSPRLVIQGGRHLLHSALQSSGVHQFIPNDTSMGAPQCTGRGEGEEGGEGGEVHLITGPNSSGKSVYVQQVGIVCYMALCGSFVPAQSATVPLLDAIHSAVAEVDSSTSTMSSFTQEAAQVAYMLRHATRLSLCLLDEVGQGTASDDGLALLTAALSLWTAQPPTCPLVLATTHFHEITTHHLLPLSHLIHPHTMSFHNESPIPPCPISISTPTLPSIIPLFKLIPGVCTDSYALSCARLVGLSPALVERAAAVEATFESGSTLGVWGWVTEEEGGRGREVEGERRVVAEFERLIDVGLEQASAAQLTAFVDLMQAEDTFLTAERKAESSAPPPPATP